jgi:hypothetical protein
MLLVGLGVVGCGGAQEPPTLLSSKTALNNANIGNAWWDANNWGDQAATTYFTWCGTDNTPTNGYNHNMSDGSCSTLGLSWSGWYDTDIHALGWTPIKIPHQSRLDNNKVWAWGYMPEMTDLVTGKQFKVLHLHPSDQAGHDAKYANAYGLGNIVPAGTVIGLSGGDTCDTGNTCACSNTGWCTAGNPASGCCLSTTHSSAAHLCINTTVLFRTAFPQNTTITPACVPTGCGAFPGRCWGDDGCGHSCACAAGFSCAVGPGACYGTYDNTDMYATGCMTSGARTGCTANRAWDGYLESRHSNNCPTVWARYTCNYPPCTGDLEAVRSSNYFVGNSVHYSFGGAAVRYTTQINSGNAGGTVYSWNSPWAPALISCNY